jgi:type IV secretion system protein VirD4
MTGFISSTDGLVLVSGHSPIRARKLRYFEDRNFRTRVLPPPTLAPGVYADRPTPRPDDWAGFVRTADARLTVAGDDDRQTAEGGLEQVRHPALPDHDIASPLDLAPADPLGLGEDDGDTASDARAMDQVRVATIARATFGLDDSSTSPGDLLLGF